MGRGLASGGTGLPERSVLLSPAIGGAPRTQPRARLVLSSSWGPPRAELLAPELERHTGFAGPSPPQRRKKYMYVFLIHVIKYRL